MVNRLLNTTVEQANSVCIWSRLQKSCGDSLSINAMDHDSFSLSRKNGITLSLKQTGSSPHKRPEG